VSIKPALTGYLTTLIHSADPRLDAPEVITEEVLAILGFSEDDCEAIGQGMIWASWKNDDGLVKRLESVYKRVRDLLPPGEK
jgi:hypothetical protein